MWGARKRRRGEKGTYSLFVGCRGGQNTEDLIVHDEETRGRSVVELHTHRVVLCLSCRRSTTSLSHLLLPSRLRSDV